MIKVILGVLLGLSLVGNLTQFREYQKLSLDKAVTKLELNTKLLGVKTDLLTAKVKYISCVATRIEDRLNNDL